jgi:hypothetical protein
MNEIEKQEIINNQAERLRQLHEELNLSTTDFCKGIGYSRPDIMYRILRKRARISDKMLAAIQNAYNVNKKWLRDGTGGMFLQGGVKLPEEGNNNCANCRAKDLRIKQLEDITEELKGIYELSKANCSEIMKEKDKLIERLSKIIEWHEQK